MGTAKLSLAEATSVDLRLAIGRVARALRQSHAVGDLTLSAATVLARLDRHGPATPSALAEAERVRPQAIASTLAALEASGHVRREADPADGRRVIVVLTEAGRSARRSRNSEALQRLEQVMVETLTAAEMRQLRDAVPLLDRLGAALGEGRS